MNLPDALIPQAPGLLGLALFAGLLARALYTAPWGRLKDATQLNLFLGAAVTLGAIWSLRAGVRPGLDLHLLGATAFTLLCGPQLAIVGLTMVLAAATYYGAGGWWSFPENGLFMIVLPVWMSYAIYRWVDRRLPNHFFVYVFINAFFVAGLAIAASGLAGSSFLALTGAYSLHYLLSQYLPYYILLAWSEALTTGMAMTLMVVYRPQWVSTFDDARYIHHK